MSSAASLPPPRYERTAGSPGLVMLSAAGLAVSIVLVLCVAAWVSRHHDTTRGIVSETSAELSFTHGPQARTSIAEDWVAQDAAVHEHLETYGWNDRSAGIARIPISRAIELMSHEATDASRKGSP